MKSIKIKNFLLVLLFLGLYGCVEEIPIKTDSFQNALVIEATITDEMKQQEILLSRSFQLEEDGPSKESSAEVAVWDDALNRYVFNEVSPGRYLSTTPFKAEQGRTYILDIVTADGKAYSSEPAVLPENAAITDLYAQRTVLQGEDGVALLLDASGPEGSSGYYRYEYEETYKIISPFSYPYDLVYRDGKFIEIPKTKEERICYNTVSSQDIILANTNAQTGKDLEHFVIRFINKENTILAHRYSILAKQYAITAEAYSYYQTLKEFSDTGSIFSQNQPGFINGNVFSVENPDEKVIGFFAVSAVDTKRIFFDFEDFFTPEEKPGWFIDCFIGRPDVSLPPLAEALGEALDRGDVKFLGATIVPGPIGSGPYRVVEAGCVDCTVHGTNVVPDFWVE